MRYVKCFSPRSMSLVTRDSALAAWRMTFAVSKIISRVEIGYLLNHYSNKYSLLLH